MDELQFISEIYTDALQYKGMRIVLKKDNIRRELVALDYDEAYGLRALIYDDTSEDAEPTIIDLNAYMKEDANND